MKKIIIALSLLTVGCKPDKIVEGSKPIFVLPNRPAPPIRPAPRPGFYTDDRLQQAIENDLQSLGSDAERQRTRYLVGCDRHNLNENLDQFEQGVNLGLNRLSAERFINFTTPIGEAGCAYRLDLDDFSITKSEWRLIEKASLLQFDISGSVRGQTIQFLAQTERPWLYATDFMVTSFEGDEVADRGGAVYYDLVDQANTTNQFLQDIGVNLQELIDAEDDILYAGFSQSQIALGKTRLIVFAESDDGWVMGTYDTALGGDDLFQNPFTLELIQFEGVLQSNKLFQHDAQEWIASQANGLFGLYRLNNALGNDGGFAESEAPTNVVSNVNNASLDPSIRILDCNHCHFSQVAIPFSDQIGGFIIRNSAFDQNEKLLAEKFFRFDEMQAVIGDINRRNRAALDELGITGNQDPINEVIARPFRREMNASQVASMTFLTTEEFLERLAGTAISSQVFGNLANGGTVSLATLSANFETLSIELNLFQD